MQAQVLNLLKGKKARLTRARKAVVDVVFEAKSPIGAPEIVNTLHARHLIVNKTTVYRELDFLLKNGILKLVFLKPGMVHYESALLPHHHHLVCNRCGSVEEVDCAIDEKKLLSKIKQKGFDLKMHKFELYGICSNCV